MDRTLLKTLFAFLIYLANHIGEVLLKGSLDGGLKRNAFIIFMLIVTLAFCWDYLFNFRRKHHFAISKWIYLVLGMAIWLFNPDWLMVAINLGIMGLFAIWDRRRKVATN